MFNFYLHYYWFSNVQVSFLLIHISQIHLLHFTMLIFIIFYSLTPMMKIIFMPSFILHGLLLALIRPSIQSMNYSLVILVCKIRSRLELLHHL
jgi:hypothetical protein